MHLVASSYTDAPSAPQPRLSSEARPSIRRSRPGSRLRGRRVRDEGADPHAGQRARAQRLEHVQHGLGG
ncbi:hypothetical protein ACWESM_26395, partial [Nocardia sp. NPDC003999]